MSVENLKEYARRCATDPELRAAARAIGTTDMDEHMRQAESLGLDWTIDDMAAFRREVVDPEGDLADLTEEELEEVAGGIVSATAAVTAASLAALGAVSAAVGVASVGAASAAVGGGVTASGHGGW